MMTNKKTNEDIDVLFSLSLVSKWFVFYFKHILLFKKTKGKDSRLQLHILQNTQLNIIILNYMNL